MGNTFSKTERLCSKIWIDHLFEKGYSWSIFPFKVLATPHPDPHADGHQILITVPKRHFKRSVDRNTLKRRIREAYRLQKHSASVSRKYLLAYIYIAKEILPSSVIHVKMREILINLPHHEMLICKVSSNK